MPDRSRPPASLPVLVTGAAGFIGFHVARRLLALGHPVVGLDNLNAYYSVALKRARLTELSGAAGFRFVAGDVADEALLLGLLREHGIAHIAHLAAQAGVRHSIENPYAYVHSNLTGQVAVFEAARKAQARHVVFASSSSVYGDFAPAPSAEAWPAAHPASLYAASKRGGELIAHAYAHLYGLPATGLRFFTVYGPWGRPDMAYWLFVQAMLEDRPIRLFNHGRLERDFTYIGDVVDGVVPLLDRPAEADPAWDAAAADPARSPAPFRLYNVGHHRPVPLTDFVAALERILGRKARVELLPMQPGDVHATCADVEALHRVTGFRPATDLETGLRAFVDWYRTYAGGNGPQAQ